MRSFSHIFSNVPSCLKPDRKKLVTLLILALFISASLPVAYKTYGMGAGTGKGTLKIINPWKAKANSYIGDLHSHTTNSDGKDTPQALVHAYKNAGYDFLAITDHGVVTTIPEDKKEGLVIINGAELYAKEGHINQLNVRACDRYYLSTAQVYKDTCKLGGYVQIDHPTIATSDDSEKFTKNELDHINCDFTFMEFIGDFSLYDHVLSNDGRVVWLTMNHDTHNAAEALKIRQYNVVNADTHTADDIMANLAAGNFYLSNGATIGDISVSGDRITLCTPDNSTIEWYGKDGSLLRKSLHVMQDSYSPTGNEKYVRMKVTRDGDLAFAYSQPLFIQVTGQA
jgi:hypothetical protein